MSNVSTLKLLNDVQIENDRLRQENAELKRKILNVDLAFEAYKARIDDERGDVKQYAELLDAIKAMKA